MRTHVPAALLVIWTSSLFGQTTIPHLTPYPGSSGGKTTVQEYGEYELLVGPASKTAPKLERIAGRVTRAVMRGPKDRSLREIFANYQYALLKGGFSTVFHCANLECGQGSTKEFGHFNSSKSFEGYYIAAKKNRPEGAVYIAVAVTDKTTINVVEVKPMQTGLVQVSALEMKNDLAATGHVVLYNILFDTGKADVKPESATAVAEVAKLLQTNSALKLHVVGHTDNAGMYDSNLDLSKRRAEAIVKELTTKHSIVGSRLRAVGVGSVAPVASNRTEDGKKQNRRVELVEQ